MVLALAGMSAFGALLHIAGSFFIVYGQTFVKVSHCIEETSSEAPSWSLSSKSNQPRWYEHTRVYNRYRTSNTLYNTNEIIAFQSLCISFFIGDGHKKLEKKPCSIQTENSSNN